MFECNFNRFDKKLAADSISNFILLAFDPSIPLFDSFSCGSNPILSYVSVWLDSTSYGCFDWKEEIERWVKKRRKEERLKERGQEGGKRNAMSDPISISQAKSLSLPFQPQTLLNHLSLSLFLSDTVSLSPLLTTPCNNDDWGWLVIQVTQN